MEFYRTVEKMVARLLPCLLLLRVVVVDVSAQPFAQGDITSDFTLTDRRTGEPVSLSDFGGQVVVLDFFAYWCAPCAFSSPDLEENIQKYYAERGGNANGVPVQVLSVNIEKESPASTDQFIASAKLDLVVDDPDAVAWNRYNEIDGIPLFVVINGVANSPGIEQWQVLHNEPSYPGAAFLRETIDTVEPAVVVDPFEEAADIGEGWRWIEGFGSYWPDPNSPWIFHEAHGWNFLGEGNLNTGQYLWDQSLGWVWISLEYYPIFFAFERNGWLRYEEGTSNPRVLFDYATNKEFSYNNALPENVDTFSNGFNIRDMSIPSNQVLRGGPPRDGIPALVDPDMISIAEATFMEDDDILMSVTSNGETRAYPYKILNWHEIVNDRIGDDAFVVTYCPLCGTGVAFDAEVNGIHHEFGVSGLLFQNNLLMYDRETFSLWSQFTLEAFSGQMKGSKLTWRRGRQMKWSRWKAEFPDGKVLSTDTGHTRNYDVNPYEGYDQGNGPLFGTGPIRDDFPAMEWVWGIKIDDVAKAYPIERLQDGVAFTDTVNGVELRLVPDVEALAIAVTVVETGEPLNDGLANFWFAWQDFFPETLVFKP